MKIPKEWNVLPLAKNSKFPPLIKEWETTQYPQEKLKTHQGNYGLGTGDISGGIIVFDWDFREGRKQEGFKIIYKELKNRFPKLLSTLTISTPH